MLEAQTQLRRLVDGFTFNAGFVGGYYDIGPESEVRVSLVIQCTQHTHEISPRKH